MWKFKKIHSESFAGSFFAPRSGVVSRGTFRFFQSSPIFSCWLFLKAWIYKRPVSHWLSVVYMSVFLLQILIGLWNCGWQKISMLNFKQRRGRGVQRNDKGVNFWFGFVPRTCANCPNESNFEFLPCRLTDHYGESPFYVIFLWKCPPKWHY